jgi:hypothetical protein
MEPLSPYTSVPISAATVVNWQVMSAIMPSAYLNSAMPVSLGTLGLIMLLISQLTVSGMPKIQFIMSMGWEESSAKMSRLSTDRRATATRSSPSPGPQRVRLRYMVSLPVSRTRYPLDIDVCGSKRICKPI